MRIMPLAAALLLVTLVGCEQQQGNSPMFGQWELDRPFTEAVLEAQESAADSGNVSSELLSALKQAARGPAVGLLLNQLDGATVTVTEDTITIMKNGSGKEQPYQYVRKSGNNQWTLKTEDGSLQTFQIVEGRLGMPMTGDLEGYVYFKPADE